uniref:NHR domain-containing protein n=1 Tax=Cyprinus carpio TaxID=7962 RepID=A0A8C1Y449_CYPCA
MIFCQSSGQMFCEHDRMCGSRCLGPMTFNKDLTGQNVTLSRGGQLASRDTSSFMNGLVFLSRTVKVDEKLCIRIEDRTSLWDGALRVGFTNICPQRNTLPPASIPDLRDTRGYCVVPVPEDLCRCGVQLQFWINYAGMVIVQEAGGEKYYLRAEGLNLNNPLWVFIDLYGSTSAVRLLSKFVNANVFTQSRSPPPVPAQQRQRFLSDSSRNSSMVIIFMIILHIFLHDYYICKKCTQDIIYFSSTGGHGLQLFTPRVSAHASQWQRARINIGFS